MKKNLSKCDFCQYKTASGCSVRPDSYYCKAAQTEFFNWLAAHKKTKK